MGQTNTARRTGRKRAGNKKGTEPAYSIEFIMSRGENAWSEIGPRASTSDHCSPPGVCARSFLGDHQIDEGRIRKRNK
jgi:hypothetical protein